MALSEMIGSIYDCALNPEHWDTTLVELTAMFRCFQAMLVNFDLTQGRGAFAKIVGVEPYWQARMDQYNPELASWHRQYFASDWPQDEPQVRSRDIPPAVVEKSPMATEWGRPQGLVDTMALVLMHTPTRYAQLGMGRHEEFGLVTGREIALGRLLAPHVRRAVTISDVIDLKTVESAMANEALDMLRVGVVLTNHAGRILHANSAAETMLRASDPIRSAGGTIQANDAAATGELHSAIALADRNESGLGGMGLAVRLTHPGQPPKLAHVLPLKQRNARLAPKAAAAVFIGPVSNGANAAEAMAVAYDLTPTETRVLNALLAGLTLTESAEQVGIGKATARTHLANMFAKTGASRQAELMLLASRLVSAG
jgi:DNA-binding CsgD family transcriptional regulator